MPREPPKSSVAVNKTTSNKPNVPTERPVDPVVARLKALRKAETDRKEQERRDKKGLQPKKIPKKIPIRTGPTKKTTPSMQQTTPKPVAPPPPARKKIKFNELMKKAQLIDHKKLSITPAIKSRLLVLDARPTKSGAPRRAGGPNEPEMGTKVRLNTTQLPARRPAGKRPPRPESSSVEYKNQSRMPKTASRVPLPVRKPSSALEQKLHSRKQTVRDSKNNYYDEEDDSDMDDFLDDDEEEEDDGGVDNGYDRDEIWAIFNRGRKRQQYAYDDDDSDDMEATGAEIFEEENRSKRRAELEDRRELEEEKRRAQAKRARLTR